MKKIVLTGDRPTGKLHLGHYSGSLKNRILLQNKYIQFVMIADTQAITDKAERTEDLEKNIFDILSDYLAVGIDPIKTTIFLQSKIPALFEVTAYFMNLVSLARLEQNPTIKSEMKEKNFARNVPVGFLTYPISQAADILSFQTDYVPVGVDQLPMIEQANEIAEKFNRTYSPIFKKTEAILSDVGRLSGIDGRGKMSKTLNNAIYLSDSSDEVKRKIMMMYTDPSHIHISDPGKIKGNIVFEYLDAFDSDREGVKNLKKRYQKGGVGDVEVKKRLFSVLEEFLTPIRSRRAIIVKNPKKIHNILKIGTINARKIAEKTLVKMKKVMKI